mmetsp:Transcript_14307/g.38938  ORF Transcript_14307/g.38938 Transcript_14307/m.38938 type:complete len:225 (-) Transcript_14307:173-847(-)
MATVDDHNDDVRTPGIVLKERATLEVTAEVYRRKSGDVSANSSPTLHPHLPVFYLFLNCVVLVLLIFNFLFVRVEDATLVHQSRVKINHNLHDDEVQKNLHQCCCYQPFLRIPTQEILDKTVHAVKCEDGHKNGRRQTNCHPSVITEVRIIVVHKPKHHHDHDHSSQQATSDGVVNRIELLLFLLGFPFFPLLSLKLLFLGLILTIFSFLCMFFTACTFRLSVG